MKAAIALKLSITCSAALGLAGACAQPADQAPAGMLEKIRVVRAKYLANSPLIMVDQYVPNLLRYDGDHLNRVRARFADELLPFFSGKLAFE